MVSNGPAQHAAINSTYFVQGLALFSVHLISRTVGCPKGSFRGARGATLLECIDICIRIAVIFNLLYFYFCRSGKARNGPVHYRPGHRGVSSRDSSFRGFQHTRQQPSSEVLPTPLIYNRQRSISRVSSEPCSISSMAHPTAPRSTKPKNDSASSVHESEPQVLSAPMDIYPINYAHEPTAPVDVHQKNRLPSWSRRKQHAASTAAANKAASAKTKAAAAKKEDDAQNTGFNGSSNIKKPPCLKQGGLSNALSREPSVRQGTALFSSGGNRSISRGPTPTRLSTGREEFVDSNEAMGSWAMRKVTFSQNGRTDSAHSDSINKVVNPSSKTNTSSDASVVDPAALAAALASFEAASGHAHVSTSNSSLSPGVIVADTSLASEWPMGTPELISRLEQRFAPPPIISAGNGLNRGGSFSISGELLGARSIISDPAIASETRGKAADPPRNARSLDGHEAVDEEEAAALALAAATGDGDGTAEWNAKFLKRWRAVKQRARLQALGMRSIWKLNSPNGSEPGGRRQHHPPELLTNELPDGPPELPFSSLSNAASGSIKETEFSMSPGSIRAAPDGGALRRGSGLLTETAAATSSSGGDGTAAGGGMHKDPSLATMLRGDVAEVC